MTEGVLIEAANLFIYIQWIKGPPFISKEKAWDIWNLSLLKLNTMNGYIQVKPQWHISVQYLRRTFLAL